MKRHDVLLGGRRRAVTVQTTIAAVLAARRTQVPLKLSVHNRTRTARFAHLHLDVCKQAAFQPDKDGDHVAGRRTTSGHQCHSSAVFCSQGSPVGA